MQRHRENANSTQKSPWSEQDVAVEKQHYSPAKMLQNTEANLQFATLYNIYIKLPNLYSTLKEMYLKSYFDSPLCCTLPTLCALVPSFKKLKPFDFSDIKQYTRTSKINDEWMIN